ncbi:MAG: hypothetical protein ACR2PZ_00240 [Pseudomonadales bacterium]
MKVVARTDEYTVYQKRNKRYGVRGADRQWLNGDEKVAVLLKHELIKAPPPKAPEPEPAEEAIEEPAAEVEAAAEASEAEGDAAESAED